MEHPSNKPRKVITDTGIKRVAMPFSRNPFERVTRNGTQVIVKGKGKGIIKGKDFMEAVFSVWFGEISADSHLKWEMLGAENN